MLTKEEAIEKLCPYQIPSSLNLEPTCECEKCMVWEWAGYRCPECGAEGSGKIKKVKMGKALVVKEDSSFSEQHGIMVCNECSTEEREVKAVPVGMCKLLK